jgi:DNA-binding CsgD family transcriptional regulator
MYYIFAVDNISHMEKSVQKEIIKLLAEGNTAKEISVLMETPKGTIQKYIELMKVVYSAKNVTHLVVIYLKLKK